MPHLSIEEQTILAIEYLVMVTYYNFERPKSEKKNLEEIVGILETLNHPNEEIEKEDIVRKYRGYAKHLKKFGAGINVKWNSPFFLTDSVSAYTDILRFYLMRTVRIYNETGLKNFIRSKTDISDSVSKNSLKKKLEEALREIVFLKYFIRYGFVYEFDYKKTMGENTERKTIPQGITVENDYLVLIATDNDGLTKKFKMSRIGKFRTDLFSAWKKVGFELEEVSGLSYEEFEKSPESNFYKENIVLTVAMSDYSFEHFRETYSLPYKFLKREAYDNIIEITHYNRIYLHSILFSYDVYIKILSPISEKLIWEEKLQRLLEKAKNS